MRGSVEYALTSAEDIKKGLDNAQSFYDQKMYYEARQKLQNLTEAYTVIPPAEQKVFDEKKFLIDSAIKLWKVTEVLRKAETLLNSGDYDTASNTLSEIDMSTTAEEQNQQINSLKERIDSARAEAERKKRENSGISAERAKQIVLNGYDIDSGDDYRTFIFNEDNEYYYIRVLWKNEYTGNYNFAGEYRVNKKTGWVYSI